MKDINFYSMVMLGILTAFVGLVSFWLYYPYKPMVINSIEVEDGKQGDVLKYSVDYCKYTDLPGVVSRQLIDNAIIFFPELSTNNPLGCLKGERFLELPGYVTPDTYVFRVSVTYRVNPIRNITIVKESNKFKVTGKTPVEVIEQVKENTQDIEKLK